MNQRLRRAGRSVSVSALVAAVAVAGTVLGPGTAAAGAAGAPAATPDRAAIVRAVEAIAARHSLRKTAKSSARVAGPTNELRFGDLTGDGRADLAAVDRAGVLFIYPGRQYEWDGAGTRPTGLFDKRIQLGRGWGAFTSLVRHGDFNDDGRQDVLTRDSQGRLSLYAGTGDPARPLRAGTPAGTGWNTFASITGCGDFDNDGHDDLLGQKSTGELLLYYGTGDPAVPFQARGTQIGTGWRGDLLTAMGDWTGDNKSEFVFRNRTGAVYQYDSRPGVRPIGKRWDILPAPEGFGVQNFVGMGDLTSDVDHFAVPDLIWQLTDGTLMVSAPDTEALKFTVGRGWSEFRIF